MWDISLWIKFYNKNYNLFSLLSLLADMQSGAMRPVFFVTLFTVRSLFTRRRQNFARFPSDKFDERVVVLCQGNGEQPLLSFEMFRFSSSTIT